MEHCFQSKFKSNENVSPLTSDRLEKENARVIQTKCLQFYYDIKYYFIIFNNDLLNRRKVNLLRFLTFFFSIIISLFEKFKKANM